MVEEKTRWQVLYTYTLVPYSRAGKWAVLTMVFTDTNIVLADLKGDAQKTADNIWSTINGTSFFSKLVVTVTGGGSPLDKLFTELKKLPDSQQIVNGGDTVNMALGNTLGYGYKPPIGPNITVYSLPIKFAYEDIKGIEFSKPDEKDYFLMSLKGLPFMYSSMGDIYMKPSLRDKVKEIILSTPLALKLKLS